MNSLNGIIILSFICDVYRQNKYKKKRKFLQFLKPFN